MDFDIYNDTFVSQLHKKNKTIYIKKLKNIYTNKNKDININII